MIYCTSYACECEPVSYKRFGMRWLFYIRIQNERILLAVPTVLLISSCYV